MNMSTLLRARTLFPARPLRLLALAWLAQLLLGVAMSRLQPIPELPLVIERSACSSAQWQRLLERYQELLAQHQLGQRHWRPVVLFGVLAEERHEQPPDPAELARAVDVGDRDPRQMLQMRRNYPGAEWLRCQDR